MTAIHDSVLVTLSASVGFGGAFTASYPTGRTAEDYLGGSDHQISSQAYRLLYANQGDFTLAFGASNITVTMQTGIALANGTVLTLLLDRAERDIGGTEDLLADQGTMTKMQMIKIDLGAPIAPSTTGVCTAEILGAAGTLPIDGTLAVDGVATLDVPRNITLTTATSNHSGVTFTVTGTDLYGNALVEQITGPNNNTVAGKKAFKTVTEVAASGAIASNGVSAGFGDVLGLPVFVADVGDLVREYEDGAAPTAGTLVAGVTTTPSATTGDVRGTYDPNSACNGTKQFDLLVAVRSATYKGADQYAG